VYGGLQDNGSWGGPSRTRGFTGAVNEDWISVGGGDGFVCRVDPNDPDLVYSESQNGAFSRRNLKTGEGGFIRPGGGGGRGGQGGGGRGGQGGPGGVRTTQGTPEPVQRGEPQPAAPTGQQTRGPLYRFNWNSPFILSNANSHIYYC